MVVQFISILVMAGCILCASAVYSVGDRANFRCPCPDVDVRCHAVQWLLNGTELHRDMYHVSKIRFNQVTQTGTVRLVHLSSTMNGSALQCKAVYLRSDVQQLGTYTYNVSTLLVEDVPIISPTSVIINSTLSDDDYVISWSPIVTSDPNPYYCVETPGTSALNCSITDTEIRFPKSACSVVCGECVFSVQGGTVVGRGPLVTVSLSSDQKGHLVADSLHYTDDDVLQVAVEPDICSANVSIRNTYTEQELLAADLNITATTTGSLVAFRVTGFRNEYSYELTFSLTNSAGTNLVTTYCCEETLPTVDYTSGINSFKASRLGLLVSTVIITAEVTSRAS